MSMKPGSIRFDDLPPNIQRDLAKSAGVSNLEHIQYFPSDLSYALNIGKIVDMHVDTENEVQVLRISYKPQEKLGEVYKTVRVAPKDQNRAPVRQVPEKPARKQNKTVGDVVTEKVVNWWKDKRPPTWMR